VANTYGEVDALAFTLRASPIPPGDAHAQVSSLCDAFHRCTGQPTGRRHHGQVRPDFEHPFVGLAVFYDATGEFIGRCSGSLLSPSLFLTAGHCIEGATSARVYFQQDAGAHYDPVTQIDPVSGYPETCLTQPCTTSSELISFGYRRDFRTRAMRHCSCSTIPSC
jgi:hypothetical protein